MGVLDPLERNAEELKQMNKDYAGMIEMTMENLERYAGAILNDRHDIIESEDPFFFLVWRDEDVIEINSMDEINQEKENLRWFKEDLSLGAVEGRFVEAFVNKYDIEPDYNNPIISYGRLDELDRRLDGLDKRIEDQIVEKFELEPDTFVDGYNQIDYRIMEMFYSLSDSINAMPVPEALSETEEIIEYEKENLLAKAVDEHREHRESINPEHDRADLPTRPIDWEEIIHEEDIRDYMDISEIPSVTYGDTLHMMMEELCDHINRVQPEYPLHFINKGNKNDTPNGNRIDNTVRPDAVDDLFVYEFKHMPRKQSLYMEENGDLERDGKFVENIQQLNGYLNDLNLPVGMLVYVSSDMEVKEYVVEQHSQNELNTDENIEQYIHEKEEYDFDSLTSRL